MSCYVMFSPYFASFLFGPLPQVKGGFLCEEMGLGKTVSSTALCIRVDVACCMLHVHVHAAYGMLSCVGGNACPHEYNDTGTRCTLGRKGIRCCRTCGGEKSEFM